MSWENEQDKIVREGRLYAAPPEMVFAELKDLSRRNRGEILSSKTEALETLLVERNDPLINLGLACYGTNKHEFAALYKHSLEPARDIADGLMPQSEMGAVRLQRLSAMAALFGLVICAAISVAGGVGRNVACNGNQADFNLFHLGPNVWRRCCTEPRPRR